MHPRLTALQQIDELDNLLTESGARPLLLFKHSYSCGISAEALDELVGHLDSTSEASRPEGPLYAMVTVQTHRDVSNAVATRLGVRHETPQALLVRDGQVIWTASHFRVTAQAVAAALAAAAR
jgi:bacillithiol system protein YtxJ